jgi:hypothetical protein
MMSFVPSPYQQTVFDWIVSGRGDGIINAVAGSGKTTTLVEGARLVHGRAMFLAFNKDIVRVLSDKLKGTSMEAKTIHSLGWSCCADRIGKGMQTQDDKYRKLVRTFVDDFLLSAQWHDDADDMPKRDELVSTLYDLVNKTRLTLTDPLDYEALWRVCDKFGINLYPPLLSAVPQILKRGEEIAKSFRLVDFTDLLWLPHVWGLMPRFRFDWVYVDECQDMSAAALDLVLKARAPGGRMLFVGDPCQPAGTTVKTPKGSVPIEQIQVGDSVVSYIPRDCAFVQKGRRINGVTARPYDGEVIVATTENGHRSVYTPNHHCYANFAPLRHGYGIYLMQRGNQFRVGKAKLDYGDNSGTGPLTRMKAEGADALWLLAVHSDKAEADVMEQAISGKFGLPQLRFTDWAKSKVMNGEQLARAWEWIGENLSRGLACLEYFGRNIRYPLFTADQEPWQYTLKRPMVVHASNLLNGVLMLPYNGNGHAQKSQWVPVELHREHYSGYVYSLEVDKEHLYIADGLVTHNCQAIMGFAGADEQSFWNIKARTNALEMPLSICYRCPRSHIVLAQEIVPHIRPRDDAPEGVVETVLEAELPKLVKEGDVILCRMTAPLISLCIKLIGMRIPARVRGRSISDQLVAMLEAITKLRGFEVDQFVEFVAKYREKELFKLAKREASDSVVEQFLDRLAGMMACYEAFDLSEAESGDALVRAFRCEIESLFSDDKASVWLSTAHRFKGQEARRVFLLKPDRMPLKYSRQQPWEIAQEYNLKYVTLTRCVAKDASAPGAFFFVVEKMPAPPAAPEPPADPSLFIHYEAGAIPVS